MKGFHTAGAAVLFRAPPTVASLHKALSVFEGFRPIEVTESPNWMGGSPGATVSFPAGGRLVAHLFERAWPDDMGDVNDDPEYLFGAWQLGFFGPAVYPGGLARAAEQAWSWRDAPAAIADHRAFVRLAVTYAIGAGPADRVIPEGYNALAELRRLTEIGRAVAELDGAVAWFDASGEVLLPPAALQETMDRVEPPPLEIWTNVRMRRIEEHPPWVLMDTVGLAQLDLDDIEACFDDRVEPKDVAGFLRNVSLYLLQIRADIVDGNTLDGPGGVWTAWNAQSLTDPPRPVLRLFPAGAKPPRVLLEGAPGARAQPPPPKSLWKRLFGG